MGTKSILQSILKSILQSILKKFTQYVHGFPGSYSRLASSGRQRTFGRSKVGF